MPAMGGDCCGADRRARQPLAVAMALAIKVFASICRCSQAASPVSGAYHTIWCGRSRRMHRRRLDTAELHGPAITCWVKRERGFGLMSQGMPVAWTPSRAAHKKARRDTAPPCHNSIVAHQAPSISAKRWKFGICGRMRVVKLVRLTVVGTLGITVNGAGGRVSKDDKGTLVPSSNAHDPGQQVSAGSPGLTQYHRDLQEDDKVQCVLQGDDNDVLYLVDRDLDDDDIDDIKACLLKLRDDGVELRELDLSDNELEEPLPTDLFENASSLRVLKINDNFLLTLPTGVFSTLSSLTHLELDGNTLEDEGVEASSFDGLTSLESLDLSGNVFEELPAGLFDNLPSSLRVLRLGSNDIELLPPGIFSTLSSMTHLYLNNNDLEDDSMPVDTFSGLTSLETLDLSDNDFEKPPPGLFEELTSLELLDFTDNEDLECLPPVCAECVLAEIIEAPSSLDDQLDAGITCGNRIADKCVLGGDDDNELDLSDMDLRDDELDEVKACLLKLKNAGQEIRHLDLSDNSQLRVLPADLFENATSLRVLRFSDNFRMEALPPGIFAMLSSLTRLFLDRVGFNDDEISVDTFSGLTSLERLYLQWSRLTTLPSGVFEDMKSTLQILNLEGLYLVRLPVGLIEELTNLEELELGYNEDLECLPSVCPACSAAGILQLRRDQEYLLEDDTFCCADANDCNVDGDVCCPAKKVCEAPSDDPGACGDPHMTGFRGQKFDFTGEDGGWYSVLSVPDIHLNMRVTSPVPSVPEITYITGISIKTTDGDGVDHTIVISVTDPHSMESACPAGVFPCLADGALSVEVDGKTALLAPGEATLGPDVAIAAANLPGACRSFGFEKYWERKKAEYAQMGRRLSAQNGMKDMAEWILGDPTATNMEECTEYVAKATAEGSDIGLFSHDSEHTSFQILTPVGHIRLSHGRLHQLPMRDPTDMFDLPDHLTWQMNLALDYTDLDESVARGILGETLVPTMDANRKPIMQGMDSIRGSEEDYRVDGPLGTAFALDLHHG